MSSNYCDSRVELGEASPLLSKASAEQQLSIESTAPKKHRRYGLAALIGVAIISVAGLLMGQHTLMAPIPLEGNVAPLSHPAPPSTSLFAPFSVVDPRKLGFPGVTRPGSTPGSAFGSLRNKNLPLPTNSWSQNLMYVRCLFIFLPEYVFIVIWR